MTLTAAQIAALRKLQDRLSLYQGDVDPRTLRALQRLRLVRKDRHRFVATRQGSMQIFDLARAGRLRRPGAGYSQGTPE